MTTSNGHHANGAATNGSASNGQAAASAPSSANLDSAPTRSPPRSVAVSIDGKPAHLSFDSSLFWITKGEHKAAASDPELSHICVPHALVLHSSFVGDSDGGSLLVRILAPPIADASPLIPLRKAKKRSAAVAALQRQLDVEWTSLGANEARRSAKALRRQLEGPCSNLRLVNIEARIESEDGSAGIDEALHSRWAQDLMDSAYRGTKPARRLKVLINPIGGPGKALPMFSSRVRPVLEAAGCRLDVQITTHHNHGIEIARTLDLDLYDGVLCVSGDGMLYEILNGFAERRDAKRALRMPVAPIPAGSGNAVAVNLMGAAQGFNLALASLNAIKGTPLPLDVCVVTQPLAPPAPVKIRKARSIRRKGSVNGGPPPASASTQGASSASESDSAPPSAAPTDASMPELSSPPALPYTRSYSFLSQSIGLMADVDLGTEDMRYLGDGRFIVGYLGGVVKNKVCDVTLEVKLGQLGTKDRKEMRAKAREFSDKGGLASKAEEEAVEGQLGDDENDDDGAAPPLKHGAVTDPIELSDLQPNLDIQDPSWPFNVGASKSPTEAELIGATEIPRDGWQRVDSEISTLYAGKLPYVARDLLQFPYALPGDGCIDVVLLMHEGGRASKLRAVGGAEDGSCVYDRAAAYFKVEAYRVTPKKTSGHLSIDGEHRPYLPFQVEVADGLALRVLSLFGEFVCPDVKPPAPPRGTQA